MTRFPFRFAVIAAICALLLGSATADARPGGGGLSFGSRGSRTFSLPGPTATAPGPVAPIQRSMTQSGQLPRVAPPSPFGGLGLGRGLLWGLIGGGLIGLLLGNGMGSIFWLILQIGAIFLLVRFAMAFFGRRAALAGNGPGYARAGLGPVGGSAGPSPSTAPLAVSPADYADFERLLAEIQAAYGREDVAALRRVTTPEMASYFEEELAANAAKGLVNKVSGGEALARRPCGSLARSRSRLRDRRDAFRDHRRDGRAHDGPHRRGRSRKARIGHGGVDFPAADRRRLAALGDPADGMSEWRVAK